MRRNPLRILLAGLMLTTTPLLAQAGHSEPAPTPLPVLDPRSDERIDLQFSEPTSVHDIYHTLSAAWGINLIFDSKLRDLEIAIDLQGVTAREGLDNVLRAVGHFYVVVDSKTLLIADDTPQNRRTYEHQVIQRFYLENTRVADMMTAIRSLVGAKHVTAMERSNSLILRDTADRVRVAEQIIRRNDQPRAEVVIDVDLLSIDRKALAQLNLKPAIDSVTATGGIPSRLRAGQLDRLRKLTSTRTLARPKLDVVADSIGELRLTDKLPIPGVSGSDDAASTSPAVAYQDVGLELKLQPWVHSAQEVTLRIEIAADTLTDWIAGPDGTELPTFGSVELASKVRLRDGETYLMTGLLIAPKRTGAGKGPLPLGRFLHEAGSGSEVVLALTPHVVRGPDLVATNLEPLWIGTESSITLSGATPRTTGPVRGPLDRESKNQNSP